VERPGEPDPCRAHPGIEPERLAKEAGGHFVLPGGGVAGAKVERPLRDVTGIETLRLLHLGERLARAARLDEDVAELRPQPGVAGRASRTACERIWTARSNMPSAA
jgi:hypothetical protein